MKTKRIFISDIHMSTNKSYSWYRRDEHEARLVGFLENVVLADQDNIKDLVLIGDTFDNWVFPANKAPATYEDIIDDNKKVIDILKKMADNNINLYFVHGNHDFDLSAKTVKSLNATLIKNGNYYMSGRLRSEHGHIHTLFNRPDWANDPAFGRSIGYFVARLITSIGDPEFRNAQSIISYIDDLIEISQPSQTVFSSILEGLAERAGVKKIRLSAKKKDFVTIETLKQRYAHLEDSIFRTARMAIDELELGFVADRLCKQFGHRVVILGHTHRAKSDRDSFLLREDRVYVNTGTWCNGTAHFVEVDKQDDGTIVSLNSVDNQGKRSKVVGSNKLSRGKYKLL